MDKYEVFLEYRMRRRRLLQDIDKTKKNDKLIELYPFTAIDVTRMKKILHLLLCQVELQLL